MPLYDLGYRAWDGPRRSFAGLWYVITSTGFALAWKSRWLRRLLYFAWLPAAFLGIGIFLFEKAVENPRARDAVREFMQFMPDTETLKFLLGMREPTTFTEHLPKSRREVWSFLILTLFRYPQGGIMVILVGLLAPPLISGDLRSRAHLIYFARPLGLVQYLIGKSGIIWGYLFVTVALPALALFVVGLLLSSHLNVLLYTWDIPLKILLGFAVLAIPTTALALAVSSMFQENRNAVATWFGIWILGSVVYTHLASMSGLSSESGEAATSSSWWTAVSLYHLLGSVQAWIFGLSPDDEAVAWKFIVLLLITLVSTVIMVRRVTAPIRA